MEITVLGSGNAFGMGGRSYSQAVVDGHVLVDLAPTTIPRLRALGLDPAGLGTVFVTHMHGDHCSGFPFLMLDYRWIRPCEGRLRIVTPERGQLEALYPASFPGHERADYADFVDWPELEADGASEGTIELEERHGGGTLHFVRHPMNHSDDLPGGCWGYTLSMEQGRDRSPTFGVTGDTGPCPGLDQLVADSDVVFIEMAVPQDIDIATHLNPGHVLELADEHPEKTFLLTHVFFPEDDIPDEPTLTELLSLENTVHCTDGLRFTIQ